MRKMILVALSATALAMALPDAVLANELKASDVFALRPSDTVPVTLDDSEMQALRGGL